MTNTVRRVLYLFAIAGLVTSLMSAWVHYQVVHQPGYTSFCDVNATVSCTTVYQSRYSMVAGFPVAILGAFWYVLVLMLLTASARGSDALRENITGYVFALATLALGGVFYLAYAAFVVLKTVCLMCVVTYVAVTAIFLLSGARTSFPMTSLPRRALRDLKSVLSSPLALVSMIVFIAAVTTTLAFYPRGQQAAATAQPPASATAQDRQSEFVRGWENAPRVTVPVSADGAAVLIVKFSDYQCPACAQSYLDYKDILAKYQAEYPGAVKFVTKDYPLERECNSNMPRDVHESACEAAAAARLARLHGRGEAMEDFLYRNHSMLTPAVVRQAAKEVGGVPDFDAQYPSILNQVKADIALATVLGIRVTPTFFVNGVKLEGGLPPQLFDTAILMELKKAGRVK
jgi:uncharacterized membrane protein/protein-disulfide isomerase